MSKPQKRLAVLLLTFTIAFNTLLPFFAFYQGQTEPSQLAKLFGDKVLICTSDGFQWVSWEDLKSGKIPVEQHKQFFCPACVIAASPISKIFALGIFVFVISRQFLSLLRFAPTAYMAFQPLWSLSYSRAPPIN
ncbi:MAG: hypothetical protein ACN2B6_08035 [Rickettsiales bacterium]